MVAAPFHDTPSPDYFLDLDHSFSQDMNNWDHVASYRSQQSAIARKRKVTNGTRWVRQKSKVHTTVCLAHTWTHHTHEKLTTRKKTHRKHKHGVNCVGKSNYKACAKGENWKALWVTQAREKTVSLVLHQLLFLTSNVYIYVFLYIPTDIFMWECIWEMIWT